MTAIAKRPAWKKARVRITCYESLGGQKRVRRIVDGYVAQGVPFAVTPAHGPPYIMRPPWTLTHRKTGSAILSFKSVAGAQRAARILSSAVPGWNRSGEAIAADNQFKAAARAAIETLIRAGAR